MRERKAAAGSGSAHDFGVFLREFRKRRDLTQGALAAKAALAVSTVQAYEQERRLPQSSDLVDRLCVALALTREDRACLRGAAGLPPPAAGLVETLTRLRPSPATIWDEAEAAEWVTLVMNERHEIVAWNGVASAVAELDLGSLAPNARNLLRMAATEHFDRHLKNWPELIGSLICVLKAEGASVEADMPAHLQALIADIANSDPRFLGPLFQMWASAPPWPEGSRNLHRIEWQVASGTRLEFVGVFRDWSVFDGLFAFDWHAANAVTSDWLRRAGGKPARRAQLPAGDGSSVGQSLAAARREVRLSRAELATRAHVPESTIEAYERGRRLHPGRDQLLQLCAGLSMDGYRTNALLRAAGYEEEPSDFSKWMSGEAPTGIYDGRQELRGSNLPAIRGEADSFAWPCFVLDGRCHVVHANAPAERLTHLSRLPALPGRPAPHLMQLAVNREIRASLLNWPEVVNTVLPGRLQPAVLGHLGGTKQESELRDVAAHVRDQDREGLSKLFDVWADPPTYTNPRRIAVSLAWRTEAGERLAFHCLLSPWNVFDPYWAMDWHPADARTFRWLARE